MTTKAASYKTGGTAETYGPSAAQLGLGPQDPPDTAPGFVADVAASVSRVTATGWGVVALAAVGLAFMAWKAT